MRSIKAGLWLVVFLSSLIAWRINFPGAFSFNNGLSMGLSIIFALIVFFSVKVDLMGKVPTLIERIYVSIASGYVIFYISSTLFSLIILLFSGESVELFVYTQYLAIPLIIIYIIGKFTSDDDKTATKG